jgi:hypothetical protein
MATFEEKMNEYVAPHASVSTMGITTLFKTKKMAAAVAAVMYLERQLEKKGGMRFDVLKRCTRS